MGGGKKDVAGKSTRHSATKGLQNVAGPQVIVVYPKSVTVEKKDPLELSLAGRPEWRTEPFIDSLVPHPKKSTTSRGLSPKRSCESRSELPSVAAAKEQRDKIKAFMVEVSKRREREHKTRLVREKKAEEEREAREKERRAEQQRRIAEAEFQDRKAKAAALEKEREAEEAAKEAASLAALKATMSGGPKKKLLKGVLGQGKKVDKGVQEDEVDIGDGYLPPPSWLNPASFSRRLGFDTKRM